MTEIERLSVSVEADLTQLIQGFLSGQTSAEKFAETIDTAVNQAVTRLEATVAKTATSVSTSLTNMTKPVETAISNLATGSEKYFGQISKSANDAASNMSKAFSSYSTAIPKVATPDISWVSKAVSAVNNVSAAASTATSSVKSFAESIAQDIGTSVESVNVTLSTLTASLGAVAAATVSVINEFGNLAIQNERAESSFMRMAESAGADGQAVLDELMGIGGGMITETEIMRNSTRALALMGSEAIGDLPKLMEIARASALEMGESLQFMFQSLVIGIGRQSPLIIDNLGIMMKLSTAQEKYAAALGKSVDALSADEKAQAFRNAVITAGEEKIARMGSATLGAAGAQMQATAAWEKFRVEIGEYFVPLLTAIYNGFTAIVNVLTSLPGPVKQAIALFIELAAAASALGLALTVYAQGGIVASIQNLIEKFMPLQTVLGGISKGLVSFGANLATVTGNTAAFTAAQATENVAVAAGAPAFAMLASAAKLAGTSIMAAITPLLPIIIPVTAAIAALALAWKTNFLGIRDAVNEVGDALKERFAKFEEIITPAIEIFKTFWEIAITPIVNSVKEWFTATVDLSGIVEWLGKVLSNESFTDFATFIVMLGQALPGIVEIFKGFAQILGPIAETLFSLFTGDLTAAAEHAKEAIARISGEADEGFKTIVKGAKDAADGFTDFQGASTLLASQTEETVRMFYKVGDSAHELVRPLYYASDAIANLYEEQEQLSEAGSLFGTGGALSSGWQRDVNSILSGARALAAGIQALESDFVDAFQAMSDSADKFALSISDEMADYEASVQEALDSYNESVADAQSDYADTLAEMEAEYQEDRADIIADGEQDIIDSEKSYYKDLQDLEADHRDKIADLEKKKLTASSFTELAAIDDEIADEKAGYEKSKTELQTAHEEELAEIRAQTEKSLSELDTRYAKQREKQQKAYEERLADLQKQYTKTTTTLAKQHEERLADLQKEYEDEKEEQRKALGELLLNLTDSLVEQGIITQEKGEAMKESIKTEYGLAKEEGTAAFKELTSNIDSELENLDLINQSGTESIWKWWQQLHDELANPETGSATLITKAINNVADAVNALPTEKTITITTKYVTEGTPPPELGDTTGSSVGGLGESYAKVQDTIDEDLGIVEEDLPKIRSMVNLLGELNEAVGGIDTIINVGTEVGKTASDKFSGLFSWVAAFFTALKESSLWTFGAEAGATAEEATTQSNKALARISSFLELFATIGDVLTTLYQEVRYLSRLTFKDVDLSGIFTFLEGILDSIRGMAAFNFGPGSAWGETEEESNKLLARVEAFAALLTTLSDLVAAFAGMPEAIKNFDEVARPEDMEAVFTQFGDDLEALLEVFRRVTDDFTVFIPDAAVQWVEAITSFYELIANMAQMPEVIKGYERLSYIRENGEVWVDEFGWIARDAVALQNAIEKAAALYGPISEDAIEWSAQVVSLFDMVVGMAQIPAIIEGYKRLSYVRENGEVWADEFGWIARDAVALKNAIEAAYLKYGEIDPLALKWAENVEKFFDFIKSAVDSMPQAEGYERLSYVREGGEVWVDEFGYIARDAVALKNAIEKAAAKFGEIDDDALTWASSMTTFFDFIKSAADAMPEAENYERMSYLRDGTEVWVKEFGYLARDAGALQNALQAAAAKFGEVSEEASAWVTAVTPFFDFIKSAVESLHLADHYKRLSYIRENGEVWVKEFGYIARDAGALATVIQAAAKRFGAVSAEASAWVAAVQPFFGFLKDAVETLGITTGYDRLSYIRESGEVWVDEFAWIARDAGALQTVIAAAAKRFGQVDQETADWAEAVDKLFSFLQNAVDTIIAINGMESIKLSSAVFGKLKQAIIRMVRVMKQVYNYFHSSAEALLPDDIDEFTATVDLIVSAIGNALDVISELRDPANRLAVPASIFETLKTNLQNMVSAMGEAAEYFDNDAGRLMLAEAQKFAEALGPIGDALGSVLQPMLDMMNVRFIPASSLTDLKENINTLVTFMFELGEQFYAGYESPALAKQALLRFKLYFETLSPALEALSTAADSIENLSGIKTPSADDRNRLEAALVAVYNQFSDFPSTLGADPEAVMAQTLAVMNSIAEVVTSAIDITDRLVKPGELPTEDEITSFVSGLKTASEAFVVYLGNIQLKVTDFLKDLTWYKKGFELGESLVDGLNATLGAFLDQLTVRQSAIVSFLEGVSWYDLGYNLGMSLVAGLSATLPSLQSTLAQISALATLPVADLSGAIGVATTSVTKSYSLTYNAGVLSGSNDAATAMKRLQFYDRLVG